MIKKFESLFVSASGTENEVEENIISVNPSDPVISLHPNTDPDTIPSVSLWENKSILLKDTLAKEECNKDGVVAGYPSPGSVYDFESECFKGKFIFRLNSMEQAKSYFEGKRRLSSVVISGKFKKELSFEDVQTGQEFPNPVQKPSQFIYKPILAFFRMLAPLLNIFVNDDIFYSLSPMMQTAQIVYVSSEQVPIEVDMSVTENFGTVMLKNDMTASERKKYFSNLENLKGNSFDTDNYYTFDFYNDKVDMETLSLKVLGMDYKLANYVNQQPLKILSRVFKSGQPNGLYLWNFEIWHESLMQVEEDDTESSESES
mmetsp:Transcript_15363/g.18634  ORF Transcript_15363/g.18634 Transcript_15363/m.18634 type:complete len:316 (-) Transcript_15363:1959-2906(-)